MRVGCASFGASSVVGAVAPLVLAVSVLPGPPLAAQVPASAGLEFQAKGTPGLETVYLVGAGSEDPEGFLRVEVWANEVTDLYGLGFALQFPEKLLKFPKSRPTVFAEGPFLSAEGAEETILLVRQQEDEIIVGFSRKGASSGASGSGLLLTLEFRGLGVAGKKALRWRRNSAFASSGAEMETVRWLGGKVLIGTGG